MDREGRCLIRLTTQEEAGYLATIATLTDPCPAPTEPYPTGLGTISPEVAASLAPHQQEDPFSGPPERESVVPPPAPPSFKKKPNLPTSKAPQKSW
jgi:hypothetical protein